MAELAASAGQGQPSETKSPAGAPGASAPPGGPPADSDATVRDAGDEPPSNDQRARLAKMLDDLEMVIDDIVANPRPAIAGRHHERLKEAWLQTKRTRLVLRGVIWDNNLAPDLARAGLGGAQLEYKLAQFAHARDELLDYGLARDGCGKKTRWWKRWFPRCRMVLKTGGLLVGSLLSATPLGEGLKEFLDAVEHGLDLGEAVLNRLR
jgi:hypothetical protein